MNTTTTGIKLQVHSRPAKLVSPTKHKVPYSPTSEGTPGSPPVVQSGTTSPIRNNRAHQRGYLPYDKPNYSNYRHAVGVIQLGSTADVHPTFVREVISLIVDFNE